MKPLTSAARRLLSLSAAAALFAGIGAAPVLAQGSIGDGRVTPLKDTSVLTNSEKDLLKQGKYKVAIVEFEDLECPACAHAAPIVKTALEHYPIAFLRHDYLIQSHAWSKQAAILARYLQDKVSPDTAEQYRRDVFANQISIGSTDDLNNFDQRWFAAHKLQMPFNIYQPDGLFTAEVQADVRTGERLGLIQTPTIIVIGPKGWLEVTNVTQLYTAIDQVMASVPAATTAHNNLKRPTTSQR